MFSFNLASNRLANIFVGIALGIGLVILYLTFLTGFANSDSRQMILLPISSVNQLKVSQYLTFTQGISNARC